MPRTSQDRARSFRIDKSGGDASLEPITVSHLSGQIVEGDWANGIVRRVEAKGHLFREGDAKSHVYKIVSGAVCLYTVLTDGRRQIIDFALEGDVIGLGFAPVEACNAQAIGPTRVRCLPVEVLLKAARQNPKVALRICEALARELVATREHLLCVGQRGATERIAAFLAILSRRNEIRGGDPRTIQLPMPRVDIADFLGLTIETVSRTLTKMRSRGLIEIHKVTTIRLRNIGELTRLADGDARV